MGRKSRTRLNSTKGFWMADKPWKAFERYVASQLGSQRVPVLGREDSDIESVNNLWVDAKLRLEVPKQYFTLIESAEKLGYEVVSLRGKTYVLMRLTTFTRLTSKQRDDQKQLQPVAAMLAVPEKGIDWLEHIASSAPEGHLALVVMCRPRMPYRYALALMRYADLISYKGGNLVRRASADHTAAAGA